DDGDIHNINDVDAHEESASDRRVLRGKDNTVWKSQAPASRQTLQHNIPRQRPGSVKSIETLFARDVFKKAKSVYDKWNAKYSDKPKKLWCEHTPEKFDGYLGILVTAGVRYSRT
ncbi:hypothetical protein ILUMI_00399, partial [Ignelater luminosus]